MISHELKFFIGIMTAYIHHFEEYVTFSTL
jgi:hypothetical protein